MAFEGAAFATNGSTTATGDSLTGNNFSIQAMVGIPIATLIFLYTLYIYSLPKPLPNITYDPVAAKSITGSAAAVIAHTKAHGTFNDFFASEAKRLNAALCQVWLGPFEKPSLILNDAREAHDVVQRRSKEFSRSTHTAVGLRGLNEEFHVGLLSTDPRYKRNKEMLKDVMTPSFLEKTAAPGVHIRASLLVDLWKTKMHAAGNRAFLAKEDLFCTVSDMITAAAFTMSADNSMVKGKLDLLRSFGTSIPVEQSANGAVQFPSPPHAAWFDAMEYVSDFLGAQLRSLFPLLLNLYTKATDSKLRESLRIISEFETGHIDKSLERMKSGDDRQSSALDSVLRREKIIAEKEKRKPEYYAHRVYDEMTGYYSAGHETSATTLAWFVKIFSKYPDVQTKLRHVLHTAMSTAVEQKREPTALEILKTSMPYTDAVIEEVLRMHPALQLISREAMVDTTLLGHFVPKGTMVWLVPLGPSYLSSALPLPDELRSETSLAKGSAHWQSLDDLHEFKPDRWLKPDEETGALRFDSKAAPMQAFGGGQRACFGRRLAYVQIKIAMALLLWNFEFLPVEGELASWDVLELTTAQPLNCYVKLRPAPSP